MKTLSEPSSIKQQHFSEQQEVTQQKYVERGFGVLQVCVVHFFSAHFYFDTNNIFLISCCLFEN
jgi:hypothetical protein